METPPAPASDPRRRGDDTFFAWFAGIFPADSGSAKPGHGDGAPPGAPEAGPDAGGDSGGDGGGGDGGGGGGD